MKMIPHEAYLVTGSPPIAKQTNPRNPHNPRQRPFLQVAELQRGNGRDNVFDSDDDRVVFLDLLAAYSFNAD